MIIIVVGLIIGHKSRYENPSSYILIGIGTFFLVLNIFHISFNNLFWPVILIAIGFYLITSVSKKNRLKIEPSTSKEPLWDKRVNDEKVSPSTDVNNNRTMKKRNKLPMETRRILAIKIMLKLTLTKKKVIQSGQTGKKTI